MPKFFDMASSKVNFEYFVAVDSFSDSKQQTPSSFGRLQNNFCTISAPRKACCISGEKMVSVPWKSATCPLPRYCKALEFVGFPTCSMPIADITHDQTACSSLSPDASATFITGQHALMVGGCPIHADRSRLLHRDIFPPPITMATSIRVRRLHDLVDHSRRSILG
jgi:hypothetical protein